MIIKLSATNFRAFENTVELNLNADMRTKRLSNNVFSLNNANILKTAGIYGSNNCGKTSFIHAALAIKGVLLGRQDFDKSVNLFSNNPVFSLSIDFLNDSDGPFYSYSFSFNATLNIFTKEKLISYTKDTSNHTHSSILYEKDIERNVYYFFGREDSEKTIKMVSGSLPIPYSFSDTDNDVKRAREILRKAGESIVVLYAPNIPINNTLETMKGDDEAKKAAIVAFTKYADLSLEGFSYDPSAKMVVAGEKGESIDEEVLAHNGNLGELLRLRSVYHGKSLPSLFFDSTGTKKIEALASYAMDALSSGKTLFIDELDSGLHFKITRAIVSLFNNVGNEKGQMIFTTHDLMLLDTKRLMRKEQIWFINKNKEDGISMYPLSSFKAKDGTRETSDIIKEYSRGRFGELPDPNFACALIAFTSKEKKGN